MKKSIDYPRWIKRGQRQIFQPYRGGWGGIVYEERLKGSESYYIVLAQDFSEGFQSLEDAKSFTEFLYKLENARQRFDFPSEPIARLPRGKQKITLRCPILNGVPRHGWLAINWNPKSARVQWDYGAFDACYPDCDRFKLILEKSNWDRELIRRLLEAGWNLHRIDRTSICWNQLKSIPHQIAQWILDTLPGVYLQACQQFAQEGEKLST